LDKELTSKKRLASANSINIARLIPQSFYYFEAYKQLGNHSLDTVFSIPSGNFGNLTAGVFAQKMGLPVHKFLAATNINDIIPAFLQTGEYKPRPSQATVSNAMDETTAAVKDIYERFGYTIDPHGAIGYLALREYADENEVNGVILETAHYAKFKDTMDESLGFETETPERLAALLDKKKVAVKMGVDYGAFKEWVI